MPMRALTSSSCAKNAAVLGMVTPSRSSTHRGSATSSDATDSSELDASVAYT